jgi:hypothetical protein
MFYRCSYNDCPLYLQERPIDEPDGQPIPAGDWRRECAACARPLDRVERDADEGETIDHVEQERPAPPDDVEPTRRERLELVRSGARNLRDQLLAATDWTQLPDAPLDDGARKAWTKYRQELRGWPATIKDPDAELELPAAP